MSSRHTCEPSLRSHVDEVRSISISSEGVAKVSVLVGSVRLVHIVIQRSGSKGLGARQAHSAMRKHGQANANNEQCWRHDLLMQGTIANVKSFAISDKIHSTVVLHCTILLGS